MTAQLKENCLIVRRDILFTPFWPKKSIGILFEHAKPNEQLKLETMITQRINKVPRRSHNGFDDLFNEIIGFPLKDINESVSKFRSRPKSNIIEVEDGFKIELVIPGFEKEDISIEMKDSILSIHSDKEVEKVETKENYTTREFSRDTFKRSFTIPDGIEESKITADLTAGILSISLPKSKKAKEKEETKQIKIS